MEMHLFMFDEKDSNNFGLLVNLLWMYWQIGLNEKSTIVGMSSSIKTLEIFSRCRSHKEDV